MTTSDQDPAKSPTTAAQDFSPAAVEERAIQREKIEGDLLVPAVTTVVLAGTSYILCSMDCRMTSLAFLAETVRIGTEVFCELCNVRREVKRDLQEVKRQMDEEASRVNR
jgi:hypothetical protein